MKKTFIDYGKTSNIGSDVYMRVKTDNFCRGCEAYRDYKQAACNVFHIHHHPCGNTIWIKQVIKQGTMNV